MSKSLLRIAPDNYGDWRWTYATDNSVTMSSYRPAASRDEALEEAKAAMEEAGVTADYVFLDGLTKPINDVLPPPKVDAILEARRGGYAAPGEEGITTKEGLEVKNKLVQKMIDADTKAAAKNEQPPDIMESEPKPRAPRKKEPEEPNPLAQQRAKAKQTLGD